MVKGIFKILIGTSVLIVLIALIVEGINLRLTGPHLRDMAKMSINQSCDFFAMETYKRDDADVVNTNDIYGNNGAIAMSGHFYDGTTKIEIYEDLYKDSEEFKNWAQENSGNWENLDLLYRGIMGISLGSEEQKMFSEFYNEVMMTPMNVGVTYLDKDTIERIAKWNFVMITSNGLNTNIILDDGTPYVKYKGFKLYYNDFAITSIDYTTYDLSNSGEKSVFEELTDLNTDNLGLDGYGDERNRVCVADIEYSIPIEYDGVTWFRTALQNLWNTEVDSYKNVYKKTEAVKYFDAAAQAGSKTTLTGGGDEDLGAFPVDGEIIYYVLR